MMDTFSGKSGHALGGVEETVITLTLAHGMIKAKVACRSP